jgi:uncharacterized membrane protein YadS
MLSVEVFQFKVQTNMKYTICHVTLLSCYFVFYYPFIFQNFKL